MDQSGDRAQAERLFHALEATVHTLRVQEGASPAVIAQSCGEFLAMILAGLSVEQGDTEAQLTGRIAVYTRRLEESIRRNVQTLRRAP